MNFVLPTIFLLFSVPLSVIDIKEYRVPDILVIPGIVVLTLLRVLIKSDQVLYFYFSLCISILIFGLVKILVRDRFGWGDIKYTFMMAALLKPAGLLLSAWSASVAGLFVYLILRLANNHFPLRQTPLPFIPFLAAASLFAWFVQNPLQNFILSAL